MIELRNVTKYYEVRHGVRYILNDVSLTIPSRTNVAVIGSNGAGKSTFLRLIGGSEPANSGTILTDSEISWPLGLASGFQGVLTGRQNVMFVCKINGLSRGDTRQVIRQVSEFAEIAEYFDMPVQTYSSGMRARLGFGLSMAFRFDVYLIDELTSVGDTNFKNKAKQAFNRISRHASLIFVSHNINTLRESCQSGLFLRDGKADFYPDIEEAIAHYAEYARAHNHKVGKDGAMRGLDSKKTRMAESKFAQKTAQEAQINSQSTQPAVDPDSNSQPPQ
ncbi:ABC transporter ATP-binding protein [Luteolibacter yonseiensis]|uniref:ABC transporter ATP-binding protein n=1 Tax=Luteolibacter yonseiensis TaxID=1144680 RepID=A0A934R3U2_9BACT|nr:ABC transporter ATP-binding protein [Luteolibacter yonseiensis]MBK1816389.1 ABC transporter ATP-binding protein [Luteolibacter yonseiensis]